MTSRTHSSLYNVDAKVRLWSWCASTRDLHHDSDVVLPVAISCFAGVKNVFCAATRNQHHSFIRSLRVTSYKDIGQSVFTALIHKTPKMKASLSSHVVKTWVGKLVSDSFLLQNTHTRSFREQNSCVTLTPVNAAREQNDAVVSVE